MSLAKDILRAFDKVTSVCENCRGTGFSRKSINESYAPCEECKACGCNLSETASLVRSFARKSSKPTREVERYWDKAKKIATRKYRVTEDDGPRFYAIVVGILKNMLKLPDDGAR